MVQTEQQNDKQPVIQRKRPLVLELLCVCSSVVFGLIALLFLLSVFYSGWISEVVSQYTPHGSYSSPQILMITLGGFILHAAAFGGIIQIWKLKKPGYYLFSIASLIISLSHLFLHTVPVSYTALYIGLIILFGLFFRKLR
jgi:hypothetical protein